MGGEEDVRGVAQRRVVFVLIDGIGDVSLPQLWDLTPLQAARTPAFDSIAGNGLNGLMDSVEPGRACGSDTAHLAILGYEPRRNYRGRGAFESMGAGCTMSPGDIAFKCNFATIDDDTGLVLQRRVDRTFDEEGPQLCQALDGIKLPNYPGHSVQVRYATEHRCGIVISGPNLIDAVSDTDPLKDSLPLRQCRPLQSSPEAEFTAALVNELSNEMHAQLLEHPVNLARRAAGKNVANVVLLRGCGIRVDLPSFQDEHGLRACIVAPTKILGGLGLTIGMEWIQVEGTTGSYDSQFHLKAKAICDAVTRGPYQFGFVHVKAVDDTGHDRLWRHRVRYLEVMDQFAAQIIRRLAEAEEVDASAEYLIVLTGDHSTPVMFGDHSHEPVPIAIARICDIVEADTARRWREAQLGSLPALSQHSMLDEATLLEQAHALAGALELEIGNSRGQHFSRQGGRGCSADQVAHFDEISAALGCLGRFPSSELMPMLSALIAIV